MQDTPLIIECFNFNSNGKHDLIGYSFSFVLSFSLQSYIDQNIKVVCLFVIRKVQKSLADLEKLHSSGQGENLLVPTGHNHANKV